MVFEAVSDSADVAEIELQLRVAAAANITLHNLTIDPVEAEVEPVELESPQTVPAACELENWLPFLETRRRGVDDRDGIFVSEGRAECSVYGPYWALPAGRYEVIASIVPSSPNPEGKPVITLDVVTEGGKRLLAMYQWRLGHFECADALTAVELRLPFAIAGDDLPIKSRQIETRIFTSGDGSFRIRSLAVRVSSAEPQRNWWPYLAAGECGIHSGDEIKSIVGEFGYVAGTPAMNIAPGNYKIIAEVVASGADAADPSVGIELEVWSGSELIDFATYHAAGTRPLKFEATENIAARGVELRFRAITPDLPLAIRNLIVELTSETVAASQMPAALRLDDWLPFLSIGTSGRRVGQHVVAERGKSGYVVYGPYWPLRPGRYKMLLLIERNETDSKSATTPERNAGVSSATAQKVLPIGRADVTFNGQQVGIARSISFGAQSGGFALVQLYFRIAGDGAGNASRVETRVWTNGDVGFRILSLSVKQRTLYDWDIRASSSAIAEAIRRKIRAALTRYAKMRK